MSFKMSFQIPGKKIKLYANQLKIITEKVFQKGKMPIPDYNVPGTIACIIIVQFWP